MTTPNLDSLLAHDAFLRALARALLRDEHGAEDVVQQTYAAALEHAPGDARSLRAWLATVTRNFALDTMRSRSSRRTRERDWSLTRRVPSAAELHEREAARKLVVDAVFRLDEPWRTAILLRFLEGMPPRGIAKHLDVPVETVRSRVKRGLELLRSQLDKSEGGRPSWTLALAPLAIVNPHWFLPEILVMSAKVKLGAAVAVVALATFFFYSFLTGPNESSSLSDPSYPAVASNSTVETKKATKLATAESAAVSSPRGASTSSRFAAGDSADLGSIEVEVVYAKDKTPAARVGVRFTPWSEGDPEIDGFWLTTDDHGIARRGHLHPGKFGLYIDRGGNGTATIEAGKESHLTLTIPVGVDVVGDVVNPSGEPIANAEVWLSGRYNHTQGHVVTRSDVKGQFELRSVTPGHNLSAFAAGYAPSYQYRVDGVKGDSTSLHLELLGAGGSLEGRVLTRDGKPIAGTTIRVGDEPKQFQSRDRQVSANSPPRQILTDVNGAFSVTGLPLGLTTVQGRKTGLAPEQLAVEISPGMAPIEIRLCEGFSISGRVLTESGEPAEGASVEAAPDLHWAGAQLSIVRGHTDAKGNYRLTGLRPGQVALDFEGRGLETCAIALLQGAAGDELRCDVKLGDYRKNTGTIAGSVVDKDGKPLVGWGVFATPQFRSNIRRIMRPNEDLTRRDILPSPSTTDSAGRFTVKECRIDATYSVSTRAPKDGVVFAEARIEPVAANGPDVVLTINTAGRKRDAFLRGKFVNSDGTPVTNATLYIIDVEYHPEQKITKGDFQFGPIVAGDVELVVNIPDGQALILRHAVGSGETWDFGTVKISEPGSLLGKLRFNGPRPTNIVRYDYFFAIYNADDPRTSPAPRSPVSKIDVQNDLLRVAKMQPGRYILTTGHFVPFEIPFEITSGKETEIEIPIKTGVFCNFQVLALDTATSLDRAHVKLTDANKSVVKELDLLTNELQRTLQFSVTLPAGTYLVEATASGGLAAKQSFTIEREDQSGTSLTLRVR